MRRGEASRTRCRTSSERDEGGEQHAGEARRHREAGVVGLRRHHEHERVLAVVVCDGQRTGGVARDDEVVRGGGQRVHELRRRSALRRVARPGERHQQDGDVLREHRPWCRDDVGARHGVEAAAGPTAQRLGGDAAGEGRRPGAGEDHAGAGVLECSAEEGVEVLPCLVEEHGEVAPRLRLLVDLAEGGAGGDGDVCGHGLPFRW
jgi:hypothetical protein